MMAGGGAGGSQHGVGLEEGDKQVRAQMQRMEARLEEYERERRRLNIVIIGIKCESVVWGKLKS